MFLWRFTQPSWAASVESVLVLQLLILGCFLCKSLFHVRNCCGNVSKTKDHIEKKAMFTVLCWLLKARIVELSNVHLAATAHAPSPPVCEFYSHCNWLGKLLKKVFYDWIIPASSCWGGICTVNCTAKLCLGLQTTSQFQNSIIIKHCQDRPYPTVLLVVMSSKQIFINTT